MCILLSSFTLFSACTNQVFVLPGFLSGEKCQGIQCVNQPPHVVSLLLAPFHVHTERAQSQRSARLSSTLRRVRCCSPRVTFTYSARTFSQKLGNAGSAQQRGHGAHELQGAPCAACYTRMVARQREGAVGARAFACAGRHCKRLRLLAYIGPGSGTHRRWRGRQWRVTGGTWAGGTWSIT